MISVQAPSRLHFGLLSFPSESLWRNRQGEKVLAARRFGSVGLMIREPGVRLTVRPAADWSAEGPLAERALAFARRFASLPFSFCSRHAPRADSLGTRSVPATERAEVEWAKLSPQHIRVEHCASEHAGLGTGTQLALSVARALQESWGLSMDGLELARQMGRGSRSALGIHGFFEGGFLVEAGIGPHETIAPLVARASFPESWPIVVVIPPTKPGLHGIDESAAFQKLQARGIPVEKTDTLCRLVLLGMIPALAERDWQIFGEALHDFNALVGETFADSQGGIYAGEVVAEIVRFIRGQGIAGAGQSSWGPAVFAVAADQDQAESVVRRIQQEFAFEPSRVFATSACNQGARVSGPG